MTETRLIEPRARATWEKALSFVSAVGSAVAAGFVPQHVYEARLASCRSCEKIDRSPDGLEYCGACDCGRWPLSRLDRKLYFPGLECPLGRAGFANAGAPPEGSAWKKCEGCSKPEPDRSPLDVGALVLIAVHLKGEEPDLRPWRVEARRGDVYELSRARRFFSWAWWKALGRRERAEVGRTALVRVA